MPLTIGADPEVFVKGANGIMGAHMVAEHFGTKKEPLKTEHGAVQVDGLALEFNVNPASTADEFVANTQGAMKDLKEIVQNIDRDMDIAIVQTHTFGEQEYAGIPEIAKRIGCEPDFNAWATDVTQPRDPPGWLRDNLQTRHTGGHIHIGWTKTPMNESDPDIWAAHLRLCQTIVRQLDYKLGIPLLSITKDNRRCEWYGQAGCFRPKSYGLEYRSPSNVWLHNEELMRFVFNQTKAALRDLQKGVDFFGLYQKLGVQFFKNGATYGIRDYCRAAGQEALDIHLKYKKEGLL